MKIKQKKRGIKLSTHDINAFIIKLQTYNYYDDSSWIVWISNLKIAKNWYDERKETNREKKQIERKEKKNNPDLDLIT